MLSVRAWDTMLRLDNTLVRLHSECLCAVLEDCNRESTEKLHVDVAWKGRLQFQGEIG